MRPIARLLFVFISLFSLVFVLRHVLTSNEPPPAAPAPAPASPGPGRFPASPALAAEKPTAATERSAPAETIAPAETAPPAATRAAVLAKIEAAYTTYRPEALPLIAPYLLDDDAEVRVAAREAVVQVGAVEGAQLLRSTARKLQDPREAVALLDAAAFLEIPPATPVQGAYPKKQHPPLGVAASLPSGAGR